jgi:outer membrane receptor protein involved in Fe transport
MKHTNDSRIMGFLDVSRPIGTMNYGAKASVDLHSFRENSSYNMIQIGGYTKFIYEDIQSDISVDLQSATNSRDITLGGVLITYNAQYQINEDITLFGFLQSGLIANSFQDMVQNNPYIIDSSVISFRRDMIHVKPSFMYQPTAKLSIQTAIDFRISSEMPVYIPNSLERNNYSGYAIEYVGANIVTLSSELLWKPNNDMSFSGLFAFTNSQLSDFDGGVPLLPSLKAGAKWDMKWNNDIQSIFSAEYIGERSIDKQSTISLPAYIMVNLQCNYALPYNMQGYIRLDNILNSKVYLWNGFQERGIFIALGLKYSL